MALTGNRILCNAPTTIPLTQLLLRRSFLLPSRPSQSQGSPARIALIVCAGKKASITGKFDSKNRRSSISTKDVDEEASEKRRADVGSGPEEIGAGVASAAAVDDGFVMPELPGEKPDFWEGPQWDAFGFFVQYMWAFGVVFALVACGIAVVTYNDGATDFKDTPVYKESVQTKELLEESDGSNSEVFESNPTEQAPALE